MRAMQQTGKLLKDVSMAEEGLMSTSVERSAQDIISDAMRLQADSGVVRAVPRIRSANAPAIGLHALDRDFEVPTDSARTAADAPVRAAHQIAVSLDLERLQRMGYVVPGRSRSPVAAQFGEIKRPLLTNARSAQALADRLALIMVTSAMPKEGKTFCAVNLALSMSLEVDTSVLLVDADVVRPGLMQRFAVQDRPGLLDLLIDRKLNVSDVVLKTNIPKLSILPAGVPSNLSSELLASDAMDELLLSLVEEDPNRVVIFDAPPLLVTTEAKILAARVGQVVMIVAASGTPRSELMEAFAKVEHCPIVMSVLNKASRPAIPLGYG